MSTGTTTSDALRLKEEGNALFGKKQFKQALEKYSAAIELDGTNAVLFANRAACLLGLRRYMEAVTNAKKATDLDPGYPKAWARLASAREELASWNEAIENWKRAIDAFPKQSELSAADQKQRDLYTENLRKVQATLERKRVGIESSANIVQMTDGKLPWQRAQQMRDQLEASKSSNSSAWVILFAYEEWQRGVQRMNKLTKFVRNGQMGMKGETQVLEALSNGIIRDSRVFHIAQEDFISRYNDQVKYEAVARKAWTDGDSKTILKAATDRLRSESWDTVRPALAVTVRAFITRAFMSHSLLQDSGAAVTIFTTCIDVLDSGMKQWPNIPVKDKGAIFCRSFSRGVKALRLEAFMAAYKVSPKRFSLEKLQEYATELYADAVADNYIADEIDAGFLLSFWTYPKGDAAATNGFCLSERGQRCTDLQEGLEIWTAAGAFYARAARIYPDDDEKRCWFLNSAIDCYRNAQAPLSTILPLLVMMKECFPKMKQIWEHSQLAIGGRDRRLEGKLQMEVEIQQKLVAGSISLTSTLSAV